MRLNIENIKMVCNYLEKHLDIDDYGDFMELDLNESLPNRHELPEIPDKEIYFIIKQLISSDCLESDQFIADTLPRITAITPKGLEFFKSMNEPKVLNKIKDQLISSVPSLISFVLQIK